VKFLIDECLGLSLAEIVQLAGFPESAHVARRGMAAWKDWELMERILEDDWTFVTRNSDDFRPRSESSSKAPCYLGIPIHPGLICLNLPAGTDLKMMENYFLAALSILEDPPNLFNQVIEVWPDEKTGVTVERYRFPKEDPDPTQDLLAQ